MYERKQIYIYVNTKDIPERCLQSYKDTADAIARGDQNVHTTQICLIDAKWLRAGYDINIIDNGVLYNFNEEYIQEFSDYPPYYMMHLFFLGELY